MFIEEIWRKYTVNIRKNIMVSEKPMEVTMEIRPIKPEEKILKDKIQSIAFLYKEDFDKKKDDPLESQDEYKTCRAAFDDTGKMCSCLEMIPFHVSFDGSVVPMGGIGGVASLPEERDNKYIRSIFNYVMQEMYDKGYVFSYLYPFSHKYYRKFGYELNMTTTNYSIPAASFRQFEQTGKLKLYTNDMDPCEIISCYEKYIRDKNLSVIRTDRLWKKFFEKDPYKDNVYLYIWYNTLGEAEGYIQFHTEKSDTAMKIMHVHELIWINREAFNGILSFVGALTAQIETLSWRSPSYVNLLPLFHEPYDIKQEIVTYGMNRIVNVEKAFNYMTLPEGSGEITIAVDDGFFPVNSGSYTIKWDNESHTVKKDQGQGDLMQNQAVLYCDVQTLSQLVTGFTGVDELKLAGKIDIKGNEKLLSRIFTKKELFINNYF